MMECYPKRNKKTLNMNNTMAINYVIQQWQLMRCHIIYSTRKRFAGTYDEQKRIPQTADGDKNGCTGLRKQTDQTGKRRALIEPS
jgi:hypothetical protein